jgi:multisubunit Na+/H+ antiporter MnhB subunit
MNVYYAGGLILGAVVWIVCAVYAYQNAPRLGRNAWLWTIICLIFGPLGLMVLFVLPKRQPAAGAGHAKQTHSSEQEALYEVPKKKHN